MKIKERMTRNFSKVKFYDKTLWHNYLIVVGVISSIVTLVSFFITAEKLQMSVGVSVTLFIGLLFGIFIYMWRKANRTICATLKINNTKVIVKEGDIFALFNRDANGEKEEISVIGSNDFYDTIVDNRVIASKSLHGQYINKIIKSEKLEAFNDTISNDERLNRAGNYIEETKREAGKIRRYSIGSVVEFESYVLAAFTKFDEFNKACLSAEEYVGFWMRFWHNIDEIYAGRTINIPLMGAGITRFKNGKPNKQELLEIMLWTLKISGFHNTYGDKQINFLIYKSDADEIDFYHIQHNKNFR